MADITAATGPTEDGAIEARRSTRAHERSKETRASVVYGERIARAVITVGGLMVIVAVLGIMVFLVRVVAPLMMSGEPRGQVSYTLDAGQDMVWINADEFQSLGTAVGADGRAISFHVPTGREIASAQLDFEGASATAVGGILTRDDVAFGFEDGTVRFLDVGFDVGTVAARNRPEDMVQLTETDFLHNGRILAPVATGDLRTITPRFEAGEPVEVSDRPIIALDYTVGGTAERPVIAFATVDADNVARVTQSRVQRNLMTGEETITSSSAELPGLNLAEGVEVTDILLAGGGDRIFIATDDGMLYRFDTRNLDNPVLAETRRVLREDVGITAMGFLGGDQSLVVGGADGSVHVYFVLQRPGTGNTDGRALVHARTHENQGTAIVGITGAQRDKSFATLGADGSVWYRHSTTDQTFFQFERTSDPDTPAEFMLFPRSNGILMVDAEGSVDAFGFNVPHPEVTLGVLFGRIWYEGYNEPSFTWQSTAGTDLAEPKYSLVPLIFGTMKATFYAMLFAVPIALMAAIYTSEFVHSGVRQTVKPIMEMMESLPTVVLGFVAALVLAPIVEEWIAAVLLAFIALPLGLMFGAFVWQTLPVPVAVRYGGVPKFFFMFVMILSPAGSPTSSGRISRVRSSTAISGQWTAGQDRDGHAVHVPDPAAALVHPRRLYVPEDLRAHLPRQAAVARPAGGGAARLPALAHLPRGGGRRLLRHRLVPDPDRLRPARRLRRHLSAAQRARRRLHHGLRGDPEHLHPVGGRAERGAEPSARGLARLRGDALADRDVGDPADGGLRRVLGGDDRHGPRRRRDDDRGDGRGQHADHGVEHLLRAAHALGQHRDRASRGGEGRDELPGAVPRGADALRHDLRHQHRAPS
jgi:phosphate transport system permease protein